MSPNLVRFSFIMVLLFGSSLCSPWEQLANAQARDYRAQAKILRILGGYRHGSMIEVEGLGSDGTTSSLWLCLDPGSEIMPREESDRLFAIALAFYSSKTEVDVHFYPGVTATDCDGGYPVVEDIRPAFPAQ